MSDLEKHLAALEAKARELGPTASFISVALDDVSATSDEQVMRLFKENVRGTDFITHIGHNYFLLLLPVDEEHALRGMQRLRALFAEEGVALAFSFGICQWHPESSIVDAIRTSEDELSKARQEPKTMDRASKAEEALKPRRATDTEDLSWRRHLKKN